MTNVSTDSLVEQTKTKAQEPQEIELRKSRKSFSFDITLQLEDGDWKLGWTVLEVCKSFVLKLQKKTRVRYN